MGGSASVRAVGLGVAGAVALVYVLAIPSCGSEQACLRNMSPDMGPDVCPSASEAFALMQSACGRVQSVDGEGELTTDGLCCYDVTYRDTESCAPPDRFGASSSAASGIITTSSAGPTSTTGTGTGTCDGSGSCDSCVACASAGACADEKLACDSNPSCATLRSCVEGCAANDTSCVDACVAGHQQGVDDLDTFYRCVICQECFADCPEASTNC